MLHFAIALELLMLGEDEGRNGNIDDKFAKRSALLLGDSCEIAKRIISKSKKLYDIRSRVAHSGKTEVPLEDVDLLERLAVRCLIYLAKNTHKWENHEEFVDWVRKEGFPEDFAIADSPLDLTS
jgi:uncharacterized membrane-anchored protein